MVLHIYMGHLSKFHLELICLLNKILLYFIHSHLVIRTVMKTTFILCLIIYLLFLAFVTEPFSEKWIFPLVQGLRKDKQLIKSQIINCQLLVRVSLGLDVSDERESLWCQVTDVRLESRVMLFVCRYYHPTEGFDRPSWEGLIPCWLGKWADCAAGPSCRDTGMDWRPSSELLMHTGHDSLCCLLSWDQGCSPI